tara:strand:- start:289 stop:426 length:138 start_codon:yes stop_codon:yes gene_type:complete
VVVEVLGLVETQVVVEVELEDIENLQELRQDLIQFLQEVLLRQQP